MKRILTALLFLLLVLTNTIHAAPVDVNKAKKVAENYLNNKGLTRNSKTPVYKSMAATICKGESFSFGGENLTQSGAYNDTIVLPSGCDSIVVLQLSVDTTENCEFNMIISTEGSDCQSNGKIKINLTGDNVPNLSQILYTVKGSGEPPSVNPEFENLPNGTYTVTVTAMLNGNHIEKTATVTILGSYVVPSAVKVVGNDSIGTRPSLNCNNTGRVQLKITGGVFPYTVKVYSADTSFYKVFNSQQNFGTSESSLDYKDYYSIENLAAGQYKFVVTDGCGYIMPEINETVKFIEACSIGISIVHFSNIYSNNIIQFYISNNSYYSIDNWEYSYSYNGGTYTNWKTIPNDGIVYDTVKNATKYCEIWDKEYIFKIRSRPKDSTETCETCTKTLKVLKPSGRISQDFKKIENADCANNVIPASISAKGYVGYSDYLNYYTLPLTIKVTNKTTGTLIDNVIDSTTISWSYSKNIPQKWYGQIINVHVTDKNGCVVADLDDTIKNPTIINTPWIGDYGLCNNSYPPDYHVCCGFQKIYVQGKVVKGCTVELFSSPNSNYYNYKAEYDKDNDKWTVVSKQNQSIRTDEIYKGCYLRDSTLMSGTYIYRITDDCGRDDTITINALFHKYEIRDSISHDSQKTCDGMHYYFKGQNIKKTTQPDGTVVSTDAYTNFSVISGVPGGYSLSRRDLYVTKPGKYIVQMYYNGSSTNACLEDYDTIVYNQQNVAIKDMAGYVCLDVGDDETTKLGNVLVRVDSTTGVAPYKFELFPQEDGGGTILETNNTGMFSNVGKVNKTLSVRITDSCGASFIQNIKMVSIGLDVKNKGWATNSTVCPGSKIELHGLQIGIGSIAKYTWTKPNGELYEGQNLIIDSATMSDSGNYYLNISGIDCPMKDTVIVNVLDVIRTTVQDTVCEGNNYSGNKFKALATSDSLPGLYTFVDTIQNNIGCDNIVTLNLTITPNVTPTFANIDTVYCEGSVIPALPTISDNNISGTWSPALNNTATTKYTFTPNANQCADTATITIIVNPKVKPLFSVDTIYCSGFNIPAFPTISDNNISGAWQPAINNAQTTTYTFTPTDGECATTSTLTIKINAKTTPTFANIDTVYCEGSVIPALPTTSDNNISGTWLPALNNTATTTYTFTPTDGECAEKTTLTIKINAKTTPTFTDVATEYCEGSAIPALPTISDNNISGAWQPAINNIQTTTYTFTPTDGECATTSTLTIKINAKAATPTFADVLTEYCEGSVITALPTVSDNNISGTWQPAINNAQTTTYTFTPTDGECAEKTTLTIKINKIPHLKIVGETEFCEGGSVVLDAGNGYSSYKWSTGATTQTITVNAEGKYVVTVANGGGCEAKDSIEIKEKKRTYSEFSEEACNFYYWSQTDKTYERSGSYIDTIRNFAGCDSIITLNLTINYTHTTVFDTTINFGDYYDKTDFHENEEGEHYKYIDNGHGCIDTLILNLKVKPTIQMPGAIDPSDDSFNRTTLRQRNQFGPIISGKATEYEYKMLIFNRWNTLIFETNKLMDEALDPTKHYWDGKFKGKTLPEDAYLYYIKIHLKKFDDIYEKKGTVSIIYK